MSEGVTNLIVPFGVGQHEGPALDGAMVGHGRRVFIGGDPAPDAYGAGGSRRDVLVPPGRCVYSWLGCADAPAIGNFCQHHYDQDRVQDALDREATRERRRKRKAELRPAQYAKHREAILKRLKDKRQGATGGATTAST